MADSWLKVQRSLWHKSICHCKPKLVEMEANVPIKDIAFEFAKF